MKILWKITSSETEQ